ncbi:MAG TPA: DUF222 domain-containing protein, partial [Mycobacteriales bacterium]|nr:DUF222 domain-containing protein [Mycobacteriales bacterium]
MFEQVSPETPAGAVLVAAESGRLDELLERLLVESPSAWSCAVLDQLGHEVTTDAQREKLYLAWERQAAWTAAQRAHAMVAAAAPQRAVVSPLGGVDDFGAELVAALSGLTLSTARRELEAARALEADLVGCRSALERGQIGWRHVMVAFEATAHLPAWARQHVDAALVCDWEVDNDLARWRVRWRREALRVDADAEQRRADAKLQRRVQCWAEPDGMATLRALLPA